MSYPPLDVSYIKFQPKIDCEYLLLDETTKLKFVHFSGNCHLGIQKCYFEVSSSALSYIQEFRSTLN